jgi:hypothetical protein
MEIFIRVIAEVIGAVTGFGAAIGSAWGNLGNIKTDLSVMVKDIAAWLLELLASISKLPGVRVLFTNANAIDLDAKRMRRSAEKEAADAMKLGSGYNAGYESPFEAGKRARDEVLKSLTEIKRREPTKLTDFEVKTPKYKPESDALAKIGGFRGGVSVANPMAQMVNEQRRTTAAVNAVKAAIASVGN